MLCEKRGGAAICKCSADRIAPRTHLGSKAMVKANIVMQRHLGIMAKARMYCGLRFWTNKMVCGRNMQHQRVINGVAFMQHLVNHDAIIAN